MTITEEMLITLQQIQQGNVCTREMGDQLVAHRLLVVNGDRLTVSWVGSIALEAYNVGVERREESARLTAV